jgi:hypothetical protein
MTANTNNRNNIFSATFSLLIDVYLFKENYQMLTKRGGEDADKISTGRSVKVAPESAEKLIKFHGADDLGIRLAQTQTLHHHLERVRAG